MNDPQNLRAALAYADLGWKVFPLRPRDKRPLTDHGFHDATTSKVQIYKWWKACPNAGVGISCGDPLIVLDLDPRNGGDQSLAALQAQYGKLPSTVEAITGGGGRHFFFRGAPVAKGKIADGLDLQAVGSYVVAPFSIHPSGMKYHWREGHDPHDKDLAPVPSWILDLLGEKEPPKPVKSHQEGEREIPQGSRDNALASLAGSMQRRGMTRNSILRALLEENKERCTPPLAETDVERIVNSIARYAPDKDASPGKPREPKFFKLADVLTMSREDPPDVDWVLPGWLARGDVSILSSIPGLGKSWVALDLALTQAARLSHMGHFPPPKEERRVLIVDEENPPDEVWRRLRALITAWEVSVPDLANNLFISQGCQGFSFREQGYVEALSKRVKELEPSLIIFDSLTAISDIKEENKAGEVRRFFHDRIYPLRAFHNATILLIHHTSKGAYAKERQVEDAGLVRGSIDMIGGPDSAFLLDKSAQGAVLQKALKVRRGSVPPALAFSLVKGVSGGLRPLVHWEGDKSGSQPNFKKERASLTIRRCLATCPEPVSLRALLSKLQDEGAKLDPTTVRRTVGELRDAGIIEASGKGSARRLALKGRGAGILEGPKG